MRKIIAAVFVSLDGVMQAPGGPEEDPTGGFAHGGWTVPYFDQDLGAAAGQTFASSFALLLGRRTYDIFAAHWPELAKEPGKSDPGEVALAHSFNRATKYVATHRPESLRWENSEALGHDIVARLREIKGEQGPDLLVQGSSELLQMLLANDLVDVLSLMIFPITLGKGKRLFGSGSLPAAFTLTRSSTSGSGVLMATYERAGAVRTGSFALEQPTDAELKRRKQLS